MVVIGDSLRERDRSLDSLNRLLLIALPLALLVAAFAGYEVAGAALRPVERMRSRAAAISESKPSERLPVPEARDEIEALGRTLNEMLDRLEAALAHERRLVGDASHELRTPLTTMRAELELALRGERDAERAARGDRLGPRGGSRACRAWPTTCSCSRAPTRAGSRSSPSRRRRVPCWRPQPSAPAPRSPRRAARSRQRRTARTARWCWPTRTAWRRRSTT